MVKSKIISTYILYSWTQLQCRLEQEPNDEQFLRRSIIERTKYLEKLGVTKVELLSKSKECYTVQYEFKGHLRTKQFQTAEIEAYKE